MVHAAREPWAVAVLLGPMLLVAAAVALRQRHAAALLACAVAAALLGWMVAAGGLHDVDRLYVLQHAGIHATLGIVFGATLRRGATPLIGILAERVQGPLPAAERRYTRRLTAVWAGYFFGMVALSLALYLLAPWWWWSLYANLITPVAALALFLGEHAAALPTAPGIRARDAGAGLAGLSRGIADSTAARTAVSDALPVLIARTLQRTLAWREGRADQRRRIHCRGRGAGRAPAARRPGRQPVPGPLSVRRRPGGGAAAWPDQPVAAQRPAADAAPARGTTAPRPMPWSTRLGRTPVGCRWSWCSASAGCRPATATRHHRR